MIGCRVGRDSDVNIHVKASACSQALSHSFVGRQRSSDVGQSHRKIWGVLIPELGKAWVLPLDQWNSSFWEGWWVATAGCFHNLDTTFSLMSSHLLSPIPNPQGGVKDRRIWSTESQVPGKLLSLFPRIRRLGGEQRSNSPVDSAILPRPTQQLLSSHHLKWLGRRLRPAGQA